MTINDDETAKNFLFFFILWKKKKDGKTLLLWDRYLPTDGL